MPDGLVFNVQRYSLQDGPGIRTTVFLKGCPLDCAWCHNPEGISHRQQTMTVETRCIRCGECTRVCPSEVGASVPASPSSLVGASVPASPPSLVGASVPASPPQPAASTKQCNLCGACVQACPTGARLIMGTRMSIDELLTTVLRDRLFYEESGGGVTFSGGEPLAQSGFLRQCLAACRSQGIHTAVDTCGYAPQKDLRDIASLTDLFLYDLKLIDESAHLKFTGKSNRLILDNFRALGCVHKAIWVRVPVIPGINDSKEELEAIAEYAFSVPNVRQVNLLPYHSNGAVKAGRLGHPARYTSTEAPAPEIMETALAIFLHAGLPAQIGG